MQARWRRSTARAAVVAAIGLLVGAFGCGSAGPKTYPVSGKVELAGAEVENLAGSHVEAALQTDMTVRASGEVQQDGSFKLESLHAGKIMHGALAGEYQVRIILSDDDKEKWRQAKKALAPRFLKFDTSGLTFVVPTTGKITLTLFKP